MKKYLSIIVIFILIIIIYFCNNIESFSTSQVITTINTEEARVSLGAPETTIVSAGATETTTVSAGATENNINSAGATENTINSAGAESDQSETPNTTSPPETISRRQFDRIKLYDYMSQIEYALSAILNLQSQNYNDELTNERIVSILNELKDEINQKNIISESVIDIGQRLQDEDIRKLKQKIDNLKNKIMEKPKSNYIKHISTGKIFEILNDSNNNKYLEINKDLNLCLSHEHNELTDDNIQKMINDNQEIKNINLEHCDFDSDKQYIYLSEEIKNKDENNPDFNKNNSQFNNELHESCRQYGSLSENSKLNNYPFYHLYPEDYDNNLNIKDKKYCLNLDKDHLSIERCSGKNSQRFLRI